MSSFILSLETYYSSLLDASQSLTKEMGTTAAAATTLIAVVAASLFWFLKHRNHIQTVLPLQDFIAVPLIDKKILSHDTRRFTFALPHPEDILGLPIGQHLTLQYTDTTTNKSIQRSYTPVTCDTVPGTFSLVVKVYRPLPPKFPKGGSMSQHLDDLKIGQTINIKGPKGHVEYLHYGKLKVKPLGKPLQTRYAQSICLLAGGTGITPMMQLLKAYVKRRKRERERKNKKNTTNVCNYTGSHITLSFPSLSLLSRSILTSPHADKNSNIRLKLIYANQTPDDILLRDELDNLQKQFPTRFSVWYTVDRVDDRNNEQQSWKYSVGFINKKMIQEHGCFLDDGNGKSSKTQFFMCGPPPMIKFACLPALQELQYTEKDWIVF